MKEKANEDKDPEEVITLRQAAEQIHHHHGRGDYAACRVISPPMKNIPYILFNTFLPYISIR